MKQLTTFEWYIQLSIQLFTLKKKFATVKMVKTVCRQVNVYGSLLVATPILVNAFETSMKAEVNVAYCVFLSVALYDL